MNISSRDTSYESNTFIVAHDKTKLAMEKKNKENNSIWGSGKTMRRWSLISFSMLIISASLCSYWYVICLINTKACCKNTTYVITYF